MDNKIKKLIAQYKEKIKSLEKKLKEKGATDTLTGNISKEIFKTPKTLPMAIKSGLVAQQNRRSKK